MINIADLLLFVHILFKLTIFAKREFYAFCLDSESPIFMLDALVEAGLIHPGLLVDSFRDVRVGWQAALLVDYWQLTFFPICQWNKTFFNLMLHIEEPEMLWPFINGLPSTRFSDHLLKHDFRCDNKRRMHFIFSEGMRVDGANFSFCNTISFSLFQWTVCAFVG